MYNQEERNNNVTFKYQQKEGGAKIGIVKVNYLLKIFVLLYYSFPNFPLHPPPSCPLPTSIVITHTIAHVHGSFTYVL